MLYILTMMWTWTRTLMSLRVVRRWPGVAALIKACRCWGNYPHAVEGNTSSVVMFSRSEMVDLRLS